jgi:hypothetical protein
MEVNMPARNLNEIQVAEITGRALSTLRNERARNDGIPYLKSVDPCVTILWMSSVLWIHTKS